MALFILVGCVQSAPLDMESTTLPAATRERLHPTEAIELAATPLATVQDESEMESMPIDPALEPLVQQARKDLSERLKVPLQAVELLGAEAVTWPDASLGCPQPGITYEQVPQEGVLIRLGVEGRMYFYHSGGSQNPFLCEDTASIVPKITPKHDEFVPPPDYEID